MATSVGIQYANALFEIAKEENQVKEYREELRKFWASIDLKDL